MARKSIPVMLIAVILVIALALMGVAYRLWAETLTIKGEVNTGNVDAGLSLEDTWDNEIVKDVGSCEAGLSEDLNRLTIKISSAYPSYECNVLFDLHNAGSIPIHVHQRVVKFPEGGVLEYKLVECYEQDVQLHTGDAAWCTLWVHVLQPAAQDASYEFSGEIFAHQYNEEPAP